MSPPGDKLTLSDPGGNRPGGNLPLGQRPIEERIAEKLQLDELNKRLAQLEAGNAALEKQIAAADSIQAQGKSGASANSFHVAHAEGWKAIAVAPDICKVGNAIVAFNSYATLDNKVTASSNVKARGTAVYRKGDVIKTVRGDAGKHIVSGTSLSAGHVKILDGHDNVKVNGQPIARHDSRCLVNCDAEGLGGAQGKLVTEVKTAMVAPPPPPKKSEDEGKEEKDRTSKRLEALKRARADVAAHMANMNAPDEFVRFRDLDEILNRWIQQVSGERGTAGDAIAQVTRGFLGFGKDLAIGIGETAYEGGKGVFKLVQLNHTENGNLIKQIDSQILAENIRLGNVTWAKAGTGVVALGSAIAKPVTDPWKKEQYGEALTRAGAEIGTLGLGALRSIQTAWATKSMSAGRRLATAESKTAAAPSAHAPAINAPVSNEKISTGLHIKVAIKPTFSGDWGNYLTKGLRSRPMDSAEGRRLIIEFEKKNGDHEEAIRDAFRLIQTGSTLPQANPVSISDKFYKIISDGNVVGANSAFWATKGDIELLHGLSYDQIADRLGLPLASQQGSKFRVIEISAIRPSTSFTSRIAPTVEIAGDGRTWMQSGGDLQTLIVDRSSFTDPIFTDISFP